MFFDTFDMLCKRKGVSCKRACAEMGLSNSTATKWKKTGATPEGATLVKVAKYFNVPLNDLVDCIEKIDLIAVTGDLSEEDTTILAQAAVQSLIHAETRASTKTPQMSDEAVRVAVAFDDADERQKGIVRLTLGISER